jgi:hypothetical protein
MPKNQPGPEREDDRRIISGIVHVHTSGWRIEAMFCHLKGLPPRRHPLRQARPQLRLGGRARRRHRLLVLTRKAVPRHECLQRAESGQLPMVSF